MSELAEPTPGPAAHSMDAQWFGVDELGHVALFETGSRGAVASDHRLGFGYDEFVDARIRVDANGEPPEPAALGLFVFVHHTDWSAAIECSDLYVREAVPAHALKVTELPVSLRALIEPLRLVGVDYRALARIQPAEHLSCRVWEGYMASDGQLRPRTPDLG
ncbi:hypothetical protein ACNOYE_25975 [Nannocystaceae bacterium ST9]